MDDSGTIAEGTTPDPRPRGRSWVLRATLVFVVINALGVVVLTRSGSARPNSCSGGFSGYSGGGGCTSDLAVVSVDAPDPVASKGRLFYLAEVTNKGPDTAFNVTISQLLPPGLQVDWVLTPEDPYGSCSLQGRTVFCTFYDIMVHQKVGMTVIVRPPSPGTLTTKVTVTSSNDDPDPSNNTARQTTTVT